MNLRKTNTVHSENERSNPLECFVRDEPNFQNDSLECISEITVKAESICPSIQVDDSKEIDFKEKEHREFRIKWKDDKTYAGLIREALENSPENKFDLSDIYKAISAKHAKYSMESPGWQNNIRHTLSLLMDIGKVRKGADGKNWRLVEDHSKPGNQLKTDQNLSMVDVNQSIDSSITGHGCKLFSILKLPL